MVDLIMQSKKKEYDLIRRNVAKQCKGTRWVFDDWISTILDGFAEFDRFNKYV